MSRCATSTVNKGVVAFRIDTDYPKGIVVSDWKMNSLNISRDAFHGEWNYTMQPAQPAVQAFVSG